jgi:hypothetical protein
MWNAFTDQDFLDITTHDGIKLTCGYMKHMTTLQEAIKGIDILHIDIQDLKLYCVGPFYPYDFNLLKCAYPQLDLVHLHSPIRHLEANYDQNFRQNYSQYFR